MTDLSDLANVSVPQVCTPGPNHQQPPLASYFEASYLEQERQKLFAEGPNYVGHSQWVPQPGDWKSLAWENDGRILVNREGQIQLLSNICRHRQAVMLRGSGNTQNIVCPLHRWTYDLEGSLLGAPHFAKQPCSKLKNYPLQDWRGLQFTGPMSITQVLAGVPFLQELNFDGFHLDSVHINTLPYNWKTFIEVYLEDYHVEPFHPGLGQFVSCNDLQWHFGQHWSVQAVGVHAALSKPGTPVYRNWHDAVMNFNAGKTPAYGAIWFCLYPNIMVEWYPNVLVISTLHPKSPSETINVVEFYYPEEICLFEREFISAEQNAYFETAKEDDDIAMRMDEGRRILLNRGDIEYGPYQSPMEDGMVHFHAWYQEQFMKGQT